MVEYPLIRENNNNRLLLEPFSDKAIDSQGFSPVLYLATLFHMLVPKAYMCLKKTTLASLTKRLSVVARVN